MFVKTRRRIVFTVVCSLLALMAVTLTVIYISNRISLWRENEKLLNTYVEQYDLEDQPGRTGENDIPDFKPDGQPDGEPPERQDGRKPMRNDPRFRLSTFYSVAYSESGEVLSIDNGSNALQSEDSLLKIASSVINSGKKRGSKGSIYYLVADRESYTLVAMIDSTIENGNQQTLIREMLIIGSAAMVILLLISVFLARRIVRPLEENDKRQKRFVSDAGHELKTPIAVISANSELLRRQSGNSEWLDNIDYENERMSDLVKQLLTLSKTENGGMPKETLDLSKLTGGEVLPFESLAFEKGKCIESDIEPGLIADGNPGQLRQLVSILLDNAVSHGTGEVIRLTLRKERHSALLTVSNDASEISADQLSHLFDRFYRADEARTESGSHYGLGLSIAQAVTEAHGGTIRAEYKDGQAIFTVSLPLKKN